MDIHTMTSPSSSHVHDSASKIKADNHHQNQHHHHHHHHHKSHSGSSGGSVPRRRRRGSWTSSPDPHLSNEMRSSSLSSDFARSSSFSSCEYDRIYSFPFFYGILTDDAEERAAATAKVVGALRQSMMSKKSRPLQAPGQPLVVAESSQQPNISTSSHSPASTSKLVNERMYNHSSDVRLFAAHMATAVRFAYEAPFPEVRLQFQKLIDDAKEYGWKPPAVPHASLFAPAICSSTADDTTLQIYIDIFLHSGRVSSVVRMMAHHPSYLKAYVDTYRGIMRSPGPLAQSWRFYIALMSASCQGSVYLTQALQTEFVMAGGNPAWLKDDAQVPEKLKALRKINAVLALQPWKLTLDDLRSVMRRPTPNLSWALGELVIALLILCHFHALAGFCNGCGLQVDSDMGIQGRNAELEALMEGEGLVLDDQRDHGTDGIGRDDDEDAECASEGVENDDDNDNDDDSDDSDDSNDDEDDDDEDDDREWRQASARTSQVRGAIISKQNQIRAASNDGANELKPTKISFDQENESPHTVVVHGSLAELDKSEEDDDVTRRTVELVRYLKVVETEENVDSDADERKPKPSPSGEDTPSIRNLGGMLKSSKSDYEIEIGKRFPSDIAQLCAMYSGLDSLGVRYEDFNPRTFDFLLFHMFDWKEESFSVLSRFDENLAQLLDYQFDLISELTDNAVGDIEGVDTAPFRRAIWLYAHRLMGVLHDDYDYRHVNVMLQKPLKVFIKKVVCVPSSVSQSDFDRMGLVLRPKEKVHIALLAMEARKQAAMIYSLQLVGKLIT